MKNIQLELKGQSEGKKYIMSKNKRNIKVKKEQNNYLK